MEYLMPLISLVITVAILKWDKCYKLRTVLKKMFWIEIIEDENNFKNEKVYKFVKGLSKLHFYPYIYFSILLAMGAVLNIEILPILIGFIFIYPFIYRFMMAIQLKIHGKDDILPK